MLELEAKTNGDTVDFIPQIGGSLTVRLDWCGGPSASLVLAPAQVAKLGAWLNGRTATTLEAVSRLEQAERAGQRLRYACMSGVALVGAALAAWVALVGVLLCSP